MLGQRKMECLRCPDGTNHSKGPVFWVRCKRQSSVRAFNAVCNLEL